MICLRFGNDDSWVLVMRSGSDSEVLGVFAFAMVISVRLAGSGLEGRGK